MELIKKIKQAETQALQIIEKAKADTAARAEENRDNRIQALAQAEQERKKAVEAAVSKARSQGLEETEKLKAQAQGQRQELRDKTAGKMAAAAAKITDYLRS